MSNEEMIRILQSIRHRHCDSLSNKQKEALSWAIAKAYKEIKND